MAADATMHIGEVAERTALSIRSLRHWEEVGLLRPSGRTEGGFRLYSEADVVRILEIRRMKPLGFSIEEMKAVLADLELLRSGGDTGGDTGDDTGARARVDAVRRDAVERRARLVRQVEMADEFLGILDARLG